MLLCGHVVSMHFSNNYKHAPYIVLAIRLGTKALFEEVKKEYIDLQISQKVEFYRREEKQLRLYFDQFCNLLPLKHVLQYIFNQTMCTNVLKNHIRRLKGQKRPQIPQNLTTLKQKCVAPHVFEYMDRQILLCSAQSVDPYTQNCVKLHNLATKVIL